MSDPDQPERRPAPRYGEYATPEEQRARTQQPGPAQPVSPIGGPPQYGASADSAQGLAPGNHVPPVMPGDTASPHPQTGPATTTAARPTRLADRIITLVLLAYGAITVFSAIPQMLDFTDFAETWMGVAGIDGDFTNFALGQQWGAIAAWVFALGWLLTAVLSWWSLSRRRLSWWIPMVGAIVTFLLVTFCLMVPLLSDPLIIEHFSTAS